MNNIQQWDHLYQVSKYPMRYPSEAVIQWLYGRFDRQSYATYKVLDVGCGSGRHSIFFAQEGLKVFANDSSMDVIDKLKKTSHNITVSVSSASQLDYPDNYFDAILHYGVLYYLTKEEALASIGEVHRVLRPGGKAFFVTKSCHDSRGIYSRYLGEGRFKMYSHEDGIHSWGGEAGMELLLPNHIELKSWFSVFREFTCEDAVTTKGKLVEYDYHVFVQKI